MVAESNARFEFPEARESIVLLELVDERFQTIYANEQFQRGANALGLDAYDPYSFLDRLDDHHRAMAMAALRDTVAQARSHRFEVPLVIAEMSVWLELTLHPWPPRGKTFVLTMMRDVTTLHRRADELRALSRAVERCPDGMALIDVAGGDPETAHTTYVNEAICSMLRETASVLIHTGLTPWFFVDESGLEQRDKIHGAFAKGRPVTVEVQAQRSDATRFWVNVSIYPIHDRADGVRTWMTVVRDVTLRRQSTDTIALLRSIIDEASDLIVITDADAGVGGPLISYANPSFAAFLAMEPRELIGVPLLSLVNSESDQRVVSSLREHFARFSSAAHELCLPRRNGSLVWMEFTARPLRDEAGAVSGWILTGRDISVRKSQYRQTAELLAALDLSDDPIAIYQVTAGDGVELTHENRAMSEGRPHLLPALLARDHASIDWQGLRSGEIAHALVRHDSETNAMWITLELRPLLGTTGRLESLVVIQHPLERRRLTGRRMSASAEAALLSEELLSFKTYAERLRALTHIIERECNSSLCAVAFEGRPHGVTIAPDRRSANAVIPAGVLDERAVLCSVTAPAALTSQQATAMRVLLETVAEGSGEGA